MKIAFTVYNLAFVSNWIERLMPYWENCEIVIFHIANLQGQKEPAIEGVKSYDVSSRSYSEIIDIIEHERIDLWINFNFRSLFELFFQRICALQNIKSVYLEHGFFHKIHCILKLKRLKKHLGNCQSPVKFLEKYIGVLYHAKRDYRNGGYCNKSILKTILSIHHLTIISFSVNVNTVCYLMFFLWMKVILH